jgi:hypothetical protein
MGTQAHQVRPSAMAAAVLVVAMMPRVASAQVSKFAVPADSSAVQEIELQDGSQLVGRITRVWGDSLSFVTLSGIILNLGARDVRLVRVVHGEMVRDEFWAADPSDSRLFLGPTARVPGHGRGYFGVYELLFPSAAVGISDRFMISAGASLVPGVSLSEQVFYFSPKLQLIDTKPVQVAAGAMWLQPGEEDGMGLAFASLTAGTSIAAFTGGVAYPFAGEGFDGQRPIVMLGGEVRVSQGIKLITENWILPDADEAALSLGVRILVRRFTIEAAAVSATDLEAVVPLVSFSVAW